MVAYDAKETNTEGKYTYLVAMLCGGVMEDPDFYYSDYQIIKANSEREACAKYDKLNNCSYYRGSVVERLT